MLSIYLLVLAFDFVYFVMHGSVPILMVTGSIHLVMFGILNFIVAYFLYKPIEDLFKLGDESERSKKRINRLTWFSTVGIFSLGTLYVALTFAFFQLFPSEVEGFTPGNIPPLLWLSFIPSLLFVYAIFPAFITYFLINDFVLDLKTKAFRQWKILFPVGKKKVGLILLLVFVILGFIPTLMVILDIMFLIGKGDQYTQFTSISPTGAVMVDRFVVLVGMVYAIVLITRSFTKPIDSLQKEISKVRQGDYSTRAPIISEDEIGVLTKGFNEMVIELENSHNELQVYSHTLEDKVRARTRELEENQARLLQSEKMAALGNLVAGVSHEINNPMGAIISTNSGAAKILERIGDILQGGAQTEELGHDKRLRKYITLLQENNKVSALAGERIQKIVRTLKNFARLDEAEFKLADIHQGIEDTLVLLHHELKRRIEVKTDFGDIPPIHCYPNQLNQVFMNIMMNAIQSIDDKGEIHIKTYSDEKLIFVEISDTGRGIPEENLGKIFDPGFTTKSSGVGTGLGLSIVYNIIDKHKGRITAESKVGEGSQFTIELPKALERG